jgi:hypothetical protein
MSHFDPVTKCLIVLVNAPTARGNPSKESPRARTRDVAIVARAAAKLIGMPQMKRSTLPNNKVAITPMSQIIERVESVAPAETSELMRRKKKLQRKLKDEERTLKAAKKKVEAGEPTVAALRQKLEEVNRLLAPPNPREEFLAALVELAERHPQYALLYHLKNVLSVDQKNIQRFFPGPRGRPPSLPTLKRYLKERIGEALSGWMRESVGLDEGATAALEKAFFPAAQLPTNHEEDRVRAAVAAHPAAPPEWRNLLVSSWASRPTLPNPRNILERPRKLPVGSPSAATLLVAARYIVGLDHRALDFDGKSATMRGLVLIGLGHRWKDIFATPAAEVKDGAAWRRTIDRYLKTSKVDYKQKEQDLPSFAEAEAAGWWPWPVTP